MNSSDDSKAGGTALAPGLRWLLGLTLASTVAALWWPQRNGSNVVVAADRDTASISEPSRLATDGGRFHAVDEARLPSTLMPISLESASSFDPFVGAIPAPAPAPKVIAPASAPSPPPPAPPPAMTYRFMGRVVDPDGQLQIYLAKGNGMVMAIPGAALEDGYTIEAVEPQAVIFLHPATGTRVRLPIPASDG